MKRHMTLSVLAVSLALALLTTLGFMVPQIDATGLAPAPSAGPVLNLYPQNATQLFQPLTIIKTVDQETSYFGALLTYVIEVTHTGDEPVMALVLDPVPDGTWFVRGSFRAEPGGTQAGYDEGANVVSWQGVLEPGTGLRLEYKLRVARCTPHEYDLENTAWAYVYGQGQMPVGSTVKTRIQPCQGNDLGDAPTRENHFGAKMMAYPGVPAEFPTVFFLPDVPPGPLHRKAWAVHLGRDISFEFDADLPPDQDGFTNLLPLPADDVDAIADTPIVGGIPDLDGFDDGVRPPAAEPCTEWVDLPVTITVNDPTLPQLDGLLYLNIWVDGNYNGHWGDVNLCGNTEVSEWILQDHAIPMSNLSVGVNTITVTTLPVYRQRATNGELLPAWMRVTLSETPAPPLAEDEAAPIEGTTVLPVTTDGRGPRDGWEYGETEDYYLPGDRKPIAIDKAADRDVAAVGDKIQYTLTVHNPNDEAAMALVYDRIPEGAHYISPTVTSSLPPQAGYKEDVNAIVWQGIIPQNGMLEITYEVEVVTCRPDGFPLINNAWVYDFELNLPQSAAVRTKIESCVGPDLGDAPDSTNHAGVSMTAYPGITAQFPTVFDVATGTPPGPLHHNAYAVHLGYRASFEKDADLWLDQDGFPNLRPAVDAANRDRFDDAFVQGLWPIQSCEAWVDLPVAITVNDPAILSGDTPLYLNMWVDGDHNGSWADAHTCANAPASEWVLQNFAIPRSSLTLGTNVISVTTQPVFRAESENGPLANWVRITLSEGEVPAITPVVAGPAGVAQSVSDGSGPSAGWGLGETEDYYLPGAPVISIDKTADKDVAASGDEIVFTISLHNSSSAPAKVFLYDLIPPGTEYVPESYLPSKQPVEGGFDVEPPPDLEVNQHWISWRGLVDGGETVRIKFKVKVVYCAPDGFKVINDAWAFEPGLPGVSATAVVEILPCELGDLGDAPDSTNHAGLDMPAYPGVIARFPTVYDSATGVPVGPIHHRPKADAWLGRWVTGEHDADLFPDADGQTNIDPEHEVADRDRADDGLVLPNGPQFPSCQPTEIQVWVTAAFDDATEEDIRERYINVWFDWNRDGDWEDAFDCPNADAERFIGALEWAVRNYAVKLSRGTHLVNLPAFLPYNPNPDEDLWMRVTLSDQPAPLNPDSGLADGRGPDAGYQFGETEDYRLHGRPPISIRKEVDQREVDLGGHLQYTVYMENQGPEPVVDVRMEDPIPPGTHYVDGSLQASKPTALFDGHAVIWEGEIDSGETVSVTFEVEVLSPSVVDEEEDLSLCGRAIRNVAKLALSDGVVVESNVAVSQVRCPDLGDAPDSTNHSRSEMTAYPGVPARYPTVFRRDPADVTPPGPLHHNPRSEAWLGYWVSGERDADLPPDEDGRLNLLPRLDEADLDGHDDGLVEPLRLPHCAPTEITVLVNVPGPTPAVVNPNVVQEYFLNVWFDWNRDGDWEDAFDCPAVEENQPPLTGVLEWAVRDHRVALGPGLHRVTLAVPGVYNPRPQLPLWARVTLSEQPAPLNPNSGLADGRGPADGYRMGETEDYLIPGRQVDPEVEIHKAVNKLHATLGDVLEYTVEIANNGPEPVPGVRMKDEIPSDTYYVDGSLWSSKPTATYADGKVTWEGDLEAHETVTVRFQVRVKTEREDETLDDFDCGDSITNRAVLHLADGITLASNEVHTRVLCPDLGDAPDSSNHAGVPMTTYPGVVTAAFPTVFDPATGAPQGPLHWLPTQDAWLGPRFAPPTGERDADLLPDEDGRPNIEPAANKANQDRADNGVRIDALDLPHCQATTLEYQVTIVGPARERFVNVWFDWNRDGDWMDQFDCPGGVATEWAVQNDVITLGPGTHTLTTTRFLPYHPDPQHPKDPMWMRITLAERPVGVVPVAAPAAQTAIPTDGSGPAEGYKYGETEDYLVGDVVSPEPPDVWVTKKLRVVDFDDEAQEGHRPPPARFIFEIEYGNSGGGPAANVVVTDVLPDHTSYRGSRSWPDIEPPTVVSPTVTWNAGTLYPGDHGRIELWFHVPPDLFQILPPGTVLTNTALISTTTAGDDPVNNTDVVTGTVPLLPPRILWPIPGTTCSGTLTVTGKSQLGTFVDLYVNGVYTATTSVDSNGNWDVPLTLPDGTHSIYAIARTVSGDTSDPSPTVVVIVDSSLLWDPMSLTFATTAPDGFVWTQHIRTADGRADPDGWSVRLPTRPDVTQQYTVTVKVCCDNPVSVTLTVSNTNYTMTGIGGGWYQTVIDAPGDPEAPITLTVDCGGTTSQGNGSGLIDPDGYIFDVDVGKGTNNLSGLTVTALERDKTTGSWDRWPAELYENQVNPQTTGSDGYYSFYTPPGDYQIVVDASVGYQGYRSWTLTVISDPVHLDIPLTKQYASVDYVVTVDSGGFVPDTLEVVQGQVVSWISGEPTSGIWHTTTSDVDARTNTAGWDSGLLDSGESYSRRFDTLGTFTYYDHENPALKGTIKVCYLYDYDCDGTVGLADIQGVATRWRTVAGKGNGYDVRYDVNGDGQINIQDIQATSNQFLWAAP